MQKNKYEIYIKYILKYAKGKRKIDFCFTNQSMVGELLLFSPQYYFF